MLEKELETAIALARSASERILEYYADEIVADQKLGIDNHYEPVTEADKTASRIIVSGLNEAFPDDEVLSEEEDDKTAKRLASSRVWIIDPIDGTAGFVKKDGDFGVQIGLAENGKALLGVVMLPFYQTLYYATTGNGAYAEAGGKTAKLTVSGITGFSEMAFAYSRNHTSKGISRIISDFGFREGVQRGSIGLKVGLIAERVCDLYIHLSPRTKLWDTCAPQVILEEAGGRITDLFGEEFRYDVADLQNHGGIVASNGVAHTAIIKRLRPLLNEFGRLKYRSSGT
ncbi:MAG: 3'(2'),5'-bisphosphate nucleotidase CysQ family protein [Blastocatellia bacterium]